MPPKRKARAADSDDEGGGRSGRADHLDLTLPPLHNIHDIFADMVSRNVDPLASVIKRLDRPLKIATMCSGTESPILALRLIFRALEEQTGVKAELDHVFSAEIEPFKQAYIERNFAPPLLFRDVVEFENDKARTAYGSFAEVPLDADMLIAGTSCVDFSNLNNRQKELDELKGGESTRTFFGMYRWVQKARPKIVILENVSGAPWTGMEKWFDTIDYATAVVRLDTKKFYIPHTRSRGYLVAFPRAKKGGAGFFDNKQRSADDLVERWRAKLKANERPASSPAELFLLESDDPRVHRARQELSHQKVNADGKRRDTVDWGRCEQRHSIARQVEKLGPKRPLTSWQTAGGRPTLPDGAWQDWAEAQTERVLDLMDISYLRQARLGVDITYKSAIWNLSQNVDRTTASKLFGITPCLTPNMIPYLTNRGGPVVGVEALALQGLPIDELLLTRENTDQLADLAGNAMSSTVVGTAMLCALLVAGNTLEPGKKGKDDDEDGDAAMDGANGKTAPPTDADLEARMRGGERLVEHPVDLASYQPAPADLLARAHSSARRCSCEGSSGTSEHAISKCDGCGQSACAAHQGKPEHRYKAVEREREDPIQFEAALKELLPMRVNVPGFDREEMTRVRERAVEKDGTVQDKTIERYLDVVADALGSAEFHFSQVVRRQHWTAIYTSEKARLELFFGETELEWRIFVHPPREVAMLDPLSLQLAQPIARIKVSPGASDLLGGQWDFSIPLADKSTTIALEYGELVESWRKRLGLDEFDEEKRPKTIKMTFKGDKALLDRQIDGTYELEAECGTATNSLYRRVEPAEATPLYFFYDPSAYLEAVHDRFVFAETCERTQTVRPLIAALEPKWRLNGTRESGDGNDKVCAPVSPALEPSISISHMWMPLPGSKLVRGANDVNEASQFSTIQTGFQLSIEDDKCQQAETLLEARVPLAQRPSDIWANEHWHEVDLQHEGAEVFSKLGWMLARIPNWQTLCDWQAVDTSSIPEHVCQACAPAFPKVEWLRRFELFGTSRWTVKVAAREDGREAAAYEARLKSRPAPIVVHTRQVGTDFHLKIALNAVSLSHRALSQLPATTVERFSPASPTVEWRLVTGASGDLGRESNVLFTLQSNRHNPEAPNPDMFSKFQLRKEQRRSLHWMIEQEANPKPWIEEEVAETLLPQLGWRAEAKARREVKICGGVVADAVGYGKTAITLALVASRRKEDAKLPEIDDRVPLKATLVVVPKHLAKQWPSEISKFTGSKLKVIAIENQAHLKKYTVEDFQNADIVVAAQSLLSSSIFWPYLADFAASPVDIKTDKKAGRYFRHCVSESMKALGKQVKRIKDDGTKAAHDMIKEARKNRSEITQTETVLNRKKANAASKGKKAVEPKLPPKPKSFGRAAAETVDDDPWDLKEKSVRKDWTQIQGPPLAMFEWARVVLDEFSYIDGSELVGIHTCRGRARWILSGTPPLRDFSEVKSIASLLNVHLGIDDEAEGVADAVKTRNSEATSAEAFRSFCDVRTRAWHKRRDDVAQRFLDQFARQNIAEIDEIPLDTELVGVRLPGAEMAIYRELEHHLQSIDPALAKLSKIKAEKQSDRDRRLREALGQSKTPEEALLKRCSHFSLDLDEDQLKDSEAPDVCDFIHDLRERQLEDCKKQVERHILATAFMYRKCISRGFFDDNSAHRNNFPTWVNALYTSGFGDIEADGCLKELAALAGCEDGEVGDSGKAPREADVKRFNADHRSGKKNKDDSDDDGPALSLSDWSAARVVMLRDAVVQLKRLVDELVGRYRSARYFDQVRKVLRTADKETDDDVAILSCCGHHGPLAEVKEAARFQKCVEPSCGSLPSSSNILTAESLGSDRDSGHFGYKLETLVTLIKETPKDDRVLVFVQFEDLFDKVHEALSVYNIPTSIMRGTSSQQSKVLSDFQTEKKRSDLKVLLLLATDSSSSGANLTSANWAFFVSPLYTDSKAKYKALATQAIGRIHRYGQAKTAKVIHLLTHATKDIDVFEERNDCVVEKVIANQPNQRGEIVNPRRERTGKWEKREVKAKKAAIKKGAAAKAKKDDTDDEDEAVVASSDEETKKARKKAAPVSKSKSKALAAKSRSKGKTIVVDDSDDVSVDDSSEEESDEEESAEETGDDNSEVGNDSDDFRMARATSGSPTPARPKNPRRSTASTAKVVIESSEDETDDDDIIIEEPARKRAKTTSKASPPKKNAQPVKRKRVIASESEDDEPAPAASKVNGKGKGKAKETASSSQSQAPPAAKKARTSMTVEIPPPTQKQRNMLDYFGGPSPTKKKRASSPAVKDTSSVKKAVRAATAESSLASGSASKASTPRLAGSDDKETDDGATALTTPADELMRELGDDGTADKVEDVVEEASGEAEV